MKILRSSLLLAGLTAAAFAATGDKPAEMPKNYPLTTCVVSDEKLGEMGKPFEYVHKETGKPDRKVYFCCEGCTDDFKKDPAKYLKKIDDAAAAKKAGGKKG